MTGYWVFVCKVTEGAYTVVNDRVLGLCKVTEGAYTVVNDRVLGLCL